MSDIRLGLMNAVAEIEQLRIQRAAAERELKEKYMRKALERARERDKLRAALVKARNATNFEERMRALAAIDAVLAETKEDGNERLHGRV